jgi:hypothetical protein
LPPKIVCLTKGSIVNLRITYTKCAKDIPALMQAEGYFDLFAVSGLLTGNYGI